MMYSKRENHYTGCMKNAIIAMRNSIIAFLYTNIFKHIVFRIDPEDVHDSAVSVGKFLGSHGLTRVLTGMFFYYSHPALEQDILGINFKNPVGLAAGFDKNAEITDILPFIGFGFAEFGSITGEQCDGNPRPRLWRLKKSQALAVYYGLKNNGAKKISAFLQNKKFRIPIGTNIAKTNSIATVGPKAGIDDYVKAFRCFTHLGDYYTINISCPNAFGGEPFQDAKHLDALLVEIDKYPTDKPIFLKISPDLSRKHIDDILDVAARHRVSGFVCTNLTKKRDPRFMIDQNAPPLGGISGKAVFDASNDVIAYVYQRTKGKYVVIGTGGVFTAEDAYKKIRLGASLVQLITSMIFMGPQNISEINRGLVRLMKRDGYRNISEVVGADHKTIQAST